MKHFLKISYNVFKFHWLYIKPCVGFFALTGLIAALITKDISWIFIQTGASFSGIFVSAYMMEVNRFKNKGHY